MAELYKYDSEKGIISPDTLAILGLVQESWATTFGSSLSLNESTLQGRIIEAIVASQKATANNMALIANQLNPEVATGSFLDAIGSWAGVERIKSSATIVFFVSMGGIAGTVIPAGAKAQDESGNIYVLIQSVTLDENGDGQGTFVNEVAGKIALAPNTLTIPIIPLESTYSGWQSVNNGNFGTIGSDFESDADYRIRIKISKAINSTSMLSSLESALYNINGLKSYSYYENYTGDVETYDAQDVRKKNIPSGESVAGHSIFLFVQGGTADESFFEQVAGAILKKRSGGCCMQASTVYPNNVKNITVTDSNSSYVMTFNVPQGIPIYVSMTVRNISYTGSALEADVKNVILNWFAGNLSAVTPFRIGLDISAFDISSIVSSQLGVIVLQCLIGLSENPTSSDLIPISINKIGITDSNSIQVTIG